MTLPVDIGLLRVFYDRNPYEKYKAVVDEGNLEQEIRLIYQAIKSYYHKHPNVMVIPEDFPTYFFHVCHPDLPKSSREIYEQIFSKITTEEFNSVDDILLKFHEQATINSIRSSIENGLDVNLLEKLLLDYKAGIPQDSDEDVIDNDLSRIADRTTSKEGLQWKLNCLNEAIGPLGPGKLVIVAAYVDVGKTAFAVSETVYMAQQLSEGKILWLNNEEDNDRVLKKIWKSTIGRSEAAIFNNQEKANRVFKQKMNGDMNRIQLIDIRKKSLSQILSLFEKYKPKLAVFDQVDKISMVAKKSFSDHDRLKSLYGEVRSIANKYCPVIAISQADASVAYLDKETQEMQYTMFPHHRQLDGSKVGKPGEGDAIVMIGRRNGAPNIRGVHVSKTKFGMPIKAEVRFDGDLCHYDNPE